MPNTIDLTGGKPTIKQFQVGRPKKEDGVASNRKEYHLTWMKNNPEKVERYRIKAMIRNRERAIQRLTDELEEYNIALEKLTSNNTNDSVGEL